jgi:hypothetical protein
MKNAMLSTILIWCLGWNPVLHAAISIVYNLRIAETTKRESFNPLFSRPAIATATLFNQWREKYNDIFQNIGGGLGTINYAPTSYFYARIDFAAAHVYEKNGAVRFSRTQTDDILFSSGYTYASSERKKITLSGLLGVPTHNDTSLEHIQFGYAHYGLGAQVDGAWHYLPRLNFSFRSAARFIHFFPRRAPAVVNNQIMNFDFNIGNLVDLFIAHHINVGRHRFEAGYNPSFFFAATIKPFLADATRGANYIRSNFYGSYKYYFPVRNHMTAIAAACSYGFDHTPQDIGNKRVITVWASWSVNF